MKCNCNSKKCRIVIINIEDNFSLKHLYNEKIRKMCKSCLEKKKIKKNLLSIKDMLNYYRLETLFHRVIHYYNSVSPYNFYFKVNLTELQNYKDKGVGVFCATKKELKKINTLLKKLNKKTIIIILKQVQLSFFDEKIKKEKLIEKINENIKNI